MPTQVPTGSDLAVRRQGGSSSRRRRRPAGPMRLSYAKGGPVPSRPKYGRGGQVLDRWGQQERFAPVHRREPESSAAAAAEATTERLPLKRLINAKPIQRQAPRRDMKEGPPRG